VPFLYGGVVGHFHWLTERQFVDAVAVAMITPGPLVITWGRLSSTASLAMY
jgi:chromate transporter